MKIRIGYVGLLLTVAIFVVFAGQTSGQSVSEATWQTSVNDSQRGVVTLGVRDKWGTMGSFTAKFVASIGRKTFRGEMSTTQDEWAYIDFPGDFQGGAPAAGTYKVTFYVKGVVIGRDRFRYRP